MFAKPRIASLLCCLLCLPHTAPARAADLAVLGIPAARAALEHLAPAYEKSTGHRLRLVFAPAAELQQRIATGMRFDVALLPASITAQHTALLREPRELARAGMGIAVRKDAAQAAPRNAAQLRELLLRVSTIAVDRAGPCADRFSLLLENLGAAEQLAPKLIATDEAPLDLLAAGRADLAVAPAGEIIARQDAILLAPWPPEVQCHQTIAGALSSRTRQRAAARALLRFVATEADVGALRGQGQEPLAEKNHSGG